MPTAGTSNTAKGKSSAAKGGRSKPGVNKDGRASSAGNDAVSLLMQDHREVERLFKAYEAAKEDERRKQEIFVEINMALKAHTTIEEEIFYPAARDVIDDDDTLNEAEVEHASAKDLMRQLEGMAPSDPYYDAKVTVLKEMIQHHVEEEETELFVECRKSDMDLKALRDELAARKDQLIGEMQAAAPRAN